MAPPSPPRPAAAAPAAPTFPAEKIPAAAAPAAETPAKAPAFVPASPSVPSQTGNGEATALANRATLFREQATVEEYSRGFTEEGESIHWRHPLTTGGKPGLWDDNWEFSFKVDGEEKTFSRQNKNLEEGLKHLGIEKIYPGTPLANLITHLDLLALAKEQLEQPRSPVLDVNLQLIHAEIEKNARADKLLPFVELPHQHQSSHRLFEPSYTSGVFQRLRKELDARGKAGITLPPAVGAQIPELSDKEKLKRKIQLTINGLRKAKPHELPNYYRRLAFLYEELSKQEKSSPEVQAANREKILNLKRRGVQEALNYLRSAELDKKQEQSVLRTLAELVISDPQVWDDRLIYGPLLEKMSKAERVYTEELKAMDEKLDGVRIYHEVILGINKALLKKEALQIALKLSKIRFAIAEYSRRNNAIEAALSQYEAAMLTNDLRSSHALGLFDSFKHIKASPDYVEQRQKCLDAKERLLSSINRNKSVLAEPLFVPLKTAAATSPASQPTAIGVPAPKSPVPLPPAAPAVPASSQAIAAAAKPAPSKASSSSSSLAAVAQPAEPSLSRLPKVPDAAIQAEHASAPQLSSSNQKTAEEVMSLYRSVTDKENATDGELEAAQKECETFLKAAQEASEDTGKILDKRTRLLGYRANLAFKQSRYMEAKRLATEAKNNEYDRLIASGSKWKTIIPQLRDASDLKIKTRSLMGLDALIEASTARLNSSE